MIGYRRDESFFCNAPLDSARNTFLTKQTVESRKRFNRKNVGFQFVFLLVCMLLMNIRLACADDWVGFQRMNTLCLIRIAGIFCALLSIKKDS